MSRKRLSQIERRTQIVDVAMHLFANKGFKGTTTRAIATAAGVSEAIIFRHFETKEDLYNAIIAHTIDLRSHLWESLDANIQTTQDLPTVMRDYAQKFIRLNRNDATFIRLMMYSSLEDHQFRTNFFAAVRSSRQSAIRKAIENSIKKGEIRPIDAALTTRSFFHTLLQYSIASFISSSSPPPPEADQLMIDNLINIFLNGLRTVPEHTLQPQNTP
jgi:AcrR family transcriptional regulator